MDQEKIYGSEYIDQPDNIYERMLYMSINVNKGTLANAQLGEEYFIKELRTDDSEMEDFLLSLGCYKGESVTVISKLSNSFVVALRDARYSIDGDLAEAICV